MRQDLIAATRLVTQKLAAMENALDDTLAAAAELTAAYPTARRMAQVSPVTGQDAVALTGDALAALFTARAKLVEAHHALAEIRDELGIPVRASGDLWKLFTKSEAQLVPIKDAAA